ncbi:MAG: DUF1501 domain-containing protein [Planctomycetaceae bacterium]
MKHVSRPGFCPRFEHVNRRSFLKGVLTTAGGLVVPNLGALFHSRALAAEAQKNGKRCILIWADGGASQFETFDMKPGRPHAGPFRPIASKLPGYQVCEYLPTIARHVDKMTIIRSMRTSRVDHPGGTYLMHTAHPAEPTIVHPEIGAVVAKHLGDFDSGLPSFVQEGGFNYSTPGSGILGPQYEPFKVGAGGKLPATVDRRTTPEHDSRRRELMRFQQESFLAEEKARPLASYDLAMTKSWELMERKNAFDVSGEWEKNRELYGDSEFGKSCLMARRLVESGVAFVEVQQQGSYDSHSDNSEWHKALLPPLDKAWSGLLVDLEQRGMLDDTLVVWVGEVGRTPRINNRAGRDHYVKAWSAALAGGGVKRGLVYGKTDEDGAAIVDSPVTEGDFFATIYKTLGIDPHTSHYAGLRPVPIVPETSKVVGDLLA